MVNYAYWAEALTGGAAGSLDAINGTDLVDKDMAVVASSTDSSAYIYWLDDDNAGAESSPTIIAPDNNGGDKRWVLMGITVTSTGLTVGSSIPFSDSSGTLTLQNIDAIDSTTETTIETAIDTLANLTSIQGQTVSFSGSLTIEGNTIANQDLTTDAAVQHARLGLGVAADANAILYAPNATYTNTALFERSGQTAESTFATMRVLATKTSDMADGFGSGIAYNIKDDAGDINLIGITGFKRSGADNTGTFVAITYKAGAQVGLFTVDQDGWATLNGGITLPNTGLHLLDTNASHDLIIAPGSDLTSDHTLTITTGDADRTLTLSGNLTVESASLINQDLTTDASPTFGGFTKVGDASNYSTVSSTGLLTMVGTARVWKCRDLTPGIVKLPAANYPAEDIIDAFPFHRYDRGTEESTYYAYTLPYDYCASSGSIRGHFSFVVENPPALETADENVRMGFEYKAVGDGDVFDFDSGTSSGYTDETIVQGEDAYEIHETAYSTCNTTGWAAGDTILFRFYRDATAVEDTYDNEITAADNDVWVFKYHIEYLSDRIGKQST